MVIILLTPLRLFHDYVSCIRISNFEKENVPPQRTERLAPLGLLKDFSLDLFVASETASTEISEWAAHNLQAPPLTSKQTDHAMRSTNEKRKQYHIPIVPPKPRVWKVHIRRPKEILGYSVSESDKKRHQRGEPVRQNLDPRSSKKKTEM